MAKNKFTNLFVALSILFFSNILFANNFFTQNQQNKFVYDFTNAITGYEATNLENDLKKLKELTNSNVYLVILNNNQNLQTDVFIKSVMNEMTNSSNLYQKFIVLFLIKNKNEMLITSDGKLDLTVDQSTLSNNLRTLFHGDVKNRLENGKYLDAINLSISNIKTYLKGYKETIVIQPNQDHDQKEVIENKKRLPKAEKNTQDALDGGDWHPKCFPEACDKNEIRSKKIKVSEISIKEFRLRMSEEELLRINPKFKKIPTQNLSATEKIYACNNNKNIDKRFFEDPKFDICGVSVGTYHPSNVIVAFRENKLSEFRIYFTDPHKKFNDLLYSLTSKFGNPSPPNNVTGKFADLDQRVWILGDNQAKVWITTTIGGIHGTAVFSIYVEDREMLDSYEFKAEQQKNQSEKSNLNDLVNRRSKDI